MLPPNVRVQTLSWWKWKRTLICATKGLGKKEARDSSRVRDVHGYWVCNAYHLSGSILRLPAKAIGQNLGRFPYGLSQRKSSS